MGMIWTCQVRGVLNENLGPWWPKDGLTYIPQSEHLQPLVARGSWHGGAELTYLGPNTKLFSVHSVRNFTGPVGLVFRGRPAGRSHGTSFPTCSVRYPYMPLHTETPSSRCTAADECGV